MDHTRFGGGGGRGGGCLVHSSMTPEKVSAQPTDDPNLPFAVCWTQQPLRQVGEACHQGQQVGGCTDGF